MSVNPEPNSSLSREEEQQQQQAAWCWTKKLMLPFLTCSLIYFIYGVGSGGFAVDYRAPIN
jgi:uncharacterized ion transporter superfamily protein YfcC